MCCRVVKTNRGAGRRGRSGINGVGRGPERQVVRSLTIVTPAGVYRGSTGGVASWSASTSRELLLELGVPAKAQCGAESR